MKNLLKYWVMSYSTFRSNFADSMNTSLPQRCTANDKTLAVHGCQTRFFFTSQVPVTAAPMEPLAFCSFTSTLILA